MLGVCMGLCLDGLGTVLDLSCRDAGPDSGFKCLICRDYGAGRDDGAVRDDGVVHDDRAHSDDDVISDDAAVYVRSVAYGNVVADYAFGLLICRMKDSIVLYVHAVADVYRTDIAAQDRTVPDAAVITDLHCTYDRRRLRQKRTFAYDGHVAL